MQKKMEAKAPDLKAEVLQHFNEPMLSGTQVVRCIGYAEDDMDCYIVARFPGGKTTWLTLVGGYTFLDRLKGQNYVKAHNGEDWDDLVRLDNELRMAGSPREDAPTILYEE